MIMPKEAIFLCFGVALIGEVNTKSSSTVFVCRWPTIPVVVNALSEVAFSF